MTLQHEITLSSSEFWCVIFSSHKQESDSGLGDFDTGGITSIREHPVFLSLSDTADTQKAAQQSSEQTQDYLYAQTKELITTNKFLTQDLKVVWYNLPPPPHQSLNGLKAFITDIINEFIATNRWQCILTLLPRHPIMAQIYHIPPIPLYPMIHIVILICILLTKVVLFIGRVILGNWIHINVTYLLGT